MQTNSLPSSITASELRANIYKILEDVEHKSRRFKITHKGKVIAVVMSEEEVESWEETLEIMSNKKLMRDIRQSEKDIKAGRVYPLEDVLKELGLNED